MTTVRVLLRSTERRLARAGVADAQLEAELLLLCSLGIDRAALYARLGDEQDDAGFKAVDALLERRLRREPIAYLMGQREFYGLDFLVAPGVLIPRPDSERLVEEALRLLRPLSEASAVIADVGCGSGVLGIALAVALPGARIHAIDISKAALDLTARNVERHALSARVHLHHGSLLEPLPERVNVIVANLPYVPTWQVPLLEPEVSRYEPREALDGGDDGLDLVRALLASAPSAMRDDGALLCELDPLQMMEARAAASVAFPRARIRVAHDLTGRERVLVVDTA